MNPIIDALYVIFAGVTMYFMFLFFLLFFADKKKLFTLPSMKKFPSLSILIPAYNEEKTIAKTLRYLKELKYPKKFEIIVIDDGSTDRTGEIAKSLKGIKVFRKKNQGKASAINYGLKHTKGEIVACVDADSYPNPDALMESVPFFKEKDVASVTASVFVNEPKNIIQNMQKIEYIMIVWARKLFESLNSVYVTPGALSLYRKDALLKVGGFDTENMTEDIEIAWRLMYHDYKIKMSLTSEVMTSVPKTFKKWWMQRLRWNVGGLQTCKKYFHTFLKKDFKSLGRFILPFFSMSYVLSLLGLGLLIYIIGRSLFDFLIFSAGAYSVGANPMNHFSLMFLPTLFTVFGIFLFVTSIIWIKISLMTVKKSIGWTKGILYLLLYLTVYITLFPFNLIHSTYRLIRGNYEWR